MRRRLFNLAAAVSLVLCVATAALWIRSYFVFDGIARAGDGRYTGIYLTAGAVVVATVGDPAVPILTANGHWNRCHDSGGNPHFDPASARMSEPRVLGFAFISAPWLVKPLRITEVIVPFWAVAAALVFLSCIMLLVRRRIAHRIQLGQCPTCGYDLRATPDRCPECGSVPAAAYARNFEEHLGHSTPYVERGK